MSNHTNTAAAKVTTVHYSEIETARNRCWDAADHFHSCAPCGASVPCSTPDEECNDYAGDCWDCMT